MRFAILVTFKVDSLFWSIDFPLIIQQVATSLQIVSAASYTLYLSASVDLTRWQMIGLL